MGSKNAAVFGIYKTSVQAESAVGQIVEFRTVAGGFTHNDISVLLPEGTTPEATTGGVVSGTLELFPGIGRLAIPGLGSFIAAGPIMAAVSVVGVNGAVGGLIGALVGMGIPEYEAERYEGRVKDGGVLLSVHCETSDQVSRAKDLLKQTGAEDISAADEKALSSHDVCN